MEESRRDLRQSLAHLHDELHGVDALDDASREQVRELIVELESLLAREPDEATSHEHASLLERFDEAARRFEAEHPVLGPPLHRVINALANLGI